MRLTIAIGNSSGLDEKSLRLLLSYLNKIKNKGLLGATAHSRAAKCNFKID